ncbi:MAG: hypothetical protein ACR2HK_11025 [Gemmatimonadales bacterium]
MSRSAQIRRAGKTHCPCSERAAQLHQGYVATREISATVALTTLVTGLAMNHVQRGSYLP